VYPTIVSFVVDAIALIILKSALGVSKNQYRYRSDKQNTLRPCSMSPFLSPPPSHHHVRRQLGCAYHYLPSLTWHKASSLMVISLSEGTPSVALPTWLFSWLQCEQPQSRGLALWIAQSVNCFLRWKF
jgi:hypothetical protein